MTALSLRWWTAVLALAACSRELDTDDLQAFGTGELPRPLAERRAPDEGLAQLCGPAITATGGLRRRPYLQQVTDTGARVLWTSTATAPGALAAGAPGAALVEAGAQQDATALLPTGTRQWEARLNGLTAAAVHCYEVREAGVAVARAPFRTAPALDSTAPVRFVAFGDSGHGGAGQRAVLAQMRTVPFELLVHTGDLAYGYGSRAQFERNHFDVYRDVLASFPLFPSIGNHEYMTELGAPYREVFSLPENGGSKGLERWYSFDWGPVHFVSLDTELAGPDEGAWLDADLAATNRPWKIVYGHRPPFSAGVHGADPLMQQHIVPVLEKHGVRLALFGHDHNYERLKPRNGVTYVITGGGGRGTRSMGRTELTAFGESVLHFVYVEVQRDELVVHAIDGVGREFDQAVVAR